MIGNSSSGLQLHSVIQCAPKKCSDLHLNVNVCYISTFYDFCFTLHLEQNCPHHLRCVHILLGKS